MPDPNAVTASFGDSTFPAQITKLEGQRGLMRVRLDHGGSYQPAEGAEGLLEMHDGSRFRVGVLELLDLGEHSGEVRVRLLGRS
ncbi:MAG TPA: hypothetical protein VNT60_11175 [Deinococcales bacterium]|nr:hypothetical protein [Deinococcales bacterium]